MAKDVTVRSVIPQVADEIGKYAFELVDWVGRGIEGNAAAAAPIGPTGNLAGSIEQKPTTGGLMGGVVEGEVVAGAEYAAYVNYGTGSRGAGSNVPGRTPEVRYSGGWVGMAARPFFSSAVETGRREFTEGWRKLEKTLPRIR